MADFKSGLDYYSHYIGMTKDSKLRKIRKAYGSTGIDVWLAVLDLIYSDKGYYIPYGDENEIDDVTWRVADYVKGKYAPDVTAVEEIIESLVACGLFSGDLFKLGILSSKRIQLQYYASTVEAEREKLSQEEKLNKLIEEASKAKAENQRLLNRTKAAAKLTAAGLSEEEYSTVLDGFVSDNEERTIGFAEALTKLIGASREKAAAAAKQELLQTPPPVSGAAPQPTAPNLAEQFAAAAKANDMLSMIKAADGLTAAQETKV